MKSARARSAPATSRCAVAVDPGDPLLPVVGQAGLKQVRRSKRAKWRAAVLIGVHVLIAAHVTHFLVAGRTLSPIEPSEAMYTLELGYVNCGFLFFGITILGTLVFGRFFCGWGCHIVALQDLCGFIMKKLGVRPRPFRSRLLALAPLIVALYMFVWPAFLRVAFGSPATPFPGFTNHLVTTSFWETFPGPVFAIVTFLVCGFAAVYFLGAKGFCTYGCPYGAFFGFADRLAPGRIVVSDACEQCGHCTATCTSNVRVHEEVRLYGMVVDPGCMKCMDCVSVCPKGALSFSFARPSAVKRPPRGEAVARRHLPWGQEAAVAGVGLAAVLAFRGLYDGPPLLLSVGLGAITAFAALEVWRLLREPTVRLQSLHLKIAGKTTLRGGLFAGAAGAWLLFTAHSGFVQWHRAWGKHHLDRTEATRAQVLGGEFRRTAYSERHRRAADAALRHFSLADRWGLVGVPEVKLGLAWISMLRDDFPAAERAAREAVALTPEEPGLWESLIEVRLASRQLPAAIEALESKLRLVEPSAEDHFRLAGWLAEAGRLPEAAERFRAAAALAPGNAAVRYNLGAVLRRLGRLEAAIEELRAARGLAPADFDTEVELGLALMAAGRGPEAVESFRSAIRLGPGRPESRGHLPDLIERIESSPAAPPAPGPGFPTP